MLCADVVVFERPGFFLGQDDHLSRAFCSEREREVLKLVAEGHHNRAIAEILHLSEKAVESHRTNIVHKLGVHEVTELVKYAIRKGLIRLE